MRKRKNIRLKNYNYSSKGFYFVTICTTRDRKCFFGQIENNILQLSDIGELAKIFWKEIPQHFPNTELGEFVIMPNHIHGIIKIVKPYHDNIIDAQPNVSARPTPYMRS